MKLGSCKDIYTDREKNFNQLSHSLLKIIFSERDELCLLLPLKIAHIIYPLSFHFC